MHNITTLNIVIQGDYTIFLPRNQLARSKCVNEIDFDFRTHRRYAIKELNHPLMGYVDAASIAIYPKTPLAAQLAGVFKPFLGLRLGTRLDLEVHSDLFKPTHIHTPEKRCRKIGTPMKRKSNRATEASSSLMIPVVSRKRAFKTRTN